MARPRGFEEAEARDRLRDLFWAKGYEGASLHDIEAATGTRKQSLYRLFGGKREMYLTALSRYGETVLAEGLALLAAEGSARDRLSRVFDSVVAAAERGDRRGCFLCAAAADQAPLDTAARQAVGAMTARLRDAIDAALAVSPPWDGDAEARADEAAHLLAAYLGLLVLSRAGAPVEVLRRGADTALARV